MGVQFPSISSSFRPVISVARWRPYVREIALADLWIAPGDAVILPPRRFPCAAAERRRSLACRSSTCMAIATPRWLPGMTRIVVAWSLRRYWSIRQRIFITTKKSRPRDTRVSRHGCEPRRRTTIRYPFSYAHRLWAYPRHLSVYGVRTPKTDDAAEGGRRGRGSSARQDASLVGHTLRLPTPTDRTSSVKRPSAWACLRDE